MTAAEELDVTARRIGEVESVTAASLVVAVDAEAPHGVALGSGVPTRFPQVNGLVVIPTDNGSVVGIVYSVGIVPADYPKRPGLRDYGLIDLPFPARRLGVTPLGVLRLAEYSTDGEPVYAINRGVLTPPTVGASVLLPTGRELAAVLEGSTAGPRVEIGEAALSRDLAVRVDPDRLFGRHLAILGNTGSGKSSTVAGLIRWSLQAAKAAAGPEDPNARFVVIDPNGEYSACFADLGDVHVFKTDPNPEEHRQLRVPAWMWNAAEWAAFSDASRGVQQPLLYQALRLLRAGSDAASDADRRLSTLSAGYASVLSGILATGPAAYSTFPGFKNVGKLLEAALESFQPYLEALDGDAKNRLESVITGIELARDSHLDQGYWTAFDEPSIVAVLQAIENLRASLPTIDLSSVVSEDAPIAFDVEDVVSHLEVLAAGEGGSASQFVSTVGLRIRTMLSHVRMRSIVGPAASQETLEGWLTDYLGPSENNRPSIAVVDLSLVPGPLMYVVAAVVARVVFEALQRYRRLNNSELPTVLVLEEAHHFASRAAERDSAVSDAAVTCRETFETIAREGRKFGLGLVVSSQRPSELSPTVLSQCNTFLLHRIVNDRDQELVRRLVPDNLGRMLDDLPTLPTQHAILLGWATAAPLLVRIRDLPDDHRPRSDDPLFWATWTHKVHRPLDWREIAEQWREGTL